MKFSISCKQLLQALRKVTSILNGKLIFPILKNVLIRTTKDNKLILISTDTEIEIVTEINSVFIYENGSITVSANKLINFCRNFNKEENLNFSLQENRMIISSRYSKCIMTSLPSYDFPNFPIWTSEIEFEIISKVFKKLIESVQFSMAYKDIRYYLNGMLIEIEKNKLNVVTTDGHRLSKNSTFIKGINERKEKSYYSVILSRKGTFELMRLLEDNQKLVKVKIGRNNISANFNSFTFTSKLIDGKFPNYKYLLEKEKKKIAKIKCNIFKQALSRLSIFSHEKFNDVRFYLSNENLKLISKNQNQELAEEILNLNYKGENIEIFFNIYYMLDILNVLKCEEIQIFLTKEIQSIYIKDCENDLASYIMMQISF